MPGLGTSGDEDNRALRNLGRTLSEVRDAAAMIETVDLLGRKYHDDAAVVRLAEVRSVFVKQRAAARRHADSESAPEEGIMALRRLRRRLNDWNIGSEFCALGPGLKKTYRGGRRALAACRKNPDADHLHKLRRRVKDFWYQVRLLESLWSDPAQSPEKALRDLQEDLGNAHNLAVLRRRADGSADGVAHMIDEFEAELCQKSLAAAKELYAEKPGAHVRRITELWEAWRGETHRKSAKQAGAGSPHASSAA